MVALAGLNPDTHAHWRHVTHRWVTLEAAATDLTVLRPWLAQIMELGDADYELLLAASQWFRSNPRSGLTIRRVPVPGMHTKWLARHRRLVLAVLGHAIGTTTNDDEANPSDLADLPIGELDALGLRPVPHEADVLLADSAHRARVGGLHHVRAPIDELARLALTPRWVLIIENKEAALALPDIDGVVIVHSLGNYIDALRNLPWIPPDRALYWGDLDRHGLTMLSRARTIMPALRSIFMSATDVDRYRHLAVTEAATRYDAPSATLTTGESVALERLASTNEYLRIEQERIPAADAHRVITDIISTA